MMDNLISSVRSAIKEVFGDNWEVTKIDFEGPFVVLYTKNMELVANQPELIKMLAMKIHRRVVIRPDPEIMMPEEEAKELIYSKVPKSAEITDIYFFKDDGEVVIEAKNPLEVRGENDKLINEIKKTIGWLPILHRTPPLKSKIVDDINALLRLVREERKKFLIDVAKRISRPRLSEEGEGMKRERILRLTALGGYQEVGRSAHLLMSNESKVLIECGYDVGNGALPYLNMPELLPLDTLDAVIITHAHIDHSGILPVLFKYNYDGPVYCTPPTRDMMTLLMLDFIKVNQNEGGKPLYNSEHIRMMLKNCIAINYGETTDITPDMRLTFHNAGHILGSSVTHIHYGDGEYNIVFTGDFKYEKTWLFNPATNKFPRVETLVMESTYGGYKDIQPSRIDASFMLTSIIKRTMERKGHILIPVFAVGRSQETMLVFNDAIKSNQMEPIDVYLDGMIYEATALHANYPEYLNSNLKVEILKNNDNPFLKPYFKMVENSAMREKIINDESPSIVLATSGMLNGGPVMEYFRNWCSDEKNTLVFVGYQAENSMGRKIQRGISEYSYMDKNGEHKTIPVKMAIETCDGFSGHSDRNQLINYVAKMEPKPKMIILSHGDPHKSHELAISLRNKFNIEVKIPYNLETVRLL
jgi:KH/beta-lactamase-domain protein